MTSRHDEDVTGPQIPQWIGTLPRGAPGRGGSVMGTDPPISLEVAMREQVELGRQTDLGRGPATRGSLGLRLVEPWTPDIAPGLSRGAAPEDRPARIHDARRQLALVGVDEAQPERPRAMVVMRQLLDAWRSAERELAATAEGSAERPQIQVHAATLRLLYQGLFAHVRYAQTERAETGP